MNEPDENAELLQRICLGDSDAMAFVNAWGNWIHDIDDIVDGQRDAAEDVIRSHVNAAVLFSLPFYQRNINWLKGIVLTTANAYADAVRWETSGIEWQRQWADFRRHAGRDMMMAVAVIVGGYDHMREMSALQWELCRKQQHQD